MPKKNPRVRTRRDSFKFKVDEVGADVVARLNKYRDEQTEEREARIQRYAKYRGWMERVNQPWDDASNMQLPTMMTDSLRVQDTLMNAVMSSRPVINSAPLTEVGKGKEETVDKLIDFQVFVEQDGEECVGELIDGFVNDGTFVAFVPWIREDRNVSDIRILPEIPETRIVPVQATDENGTPLEDENGPIIVPEEEEMPIVDYFISQLELFFPEAILEAFNDGWTWQGFIPEEDRSIPIKIDFYTMKDDRVEMVIEKEVRVYDGPKIIVKDIEDVVAPGRADNLQAPSPSNPGGAGTVFLLDYPYVDEIRRLHKSGFYDLIKEEDLKKMDNHQHAIGSEDDREKTQKDRMEGTHSYRDEGKLTRIVAFDQYDIDGDGILEDVIFWVIKETGTVLKAKVLTEMYPANPPRRPIVEKQFLKVKGRWKGIGLLEMMEGLSDASKEVFDQMVDGGDITNTPFGFYKSTSAIRQEPIRYAPGELYPTTDPQGDVHFPSLPHSDQSFRFNLLSMLQQYKERLTMVGELQFGRVPAGKASALRTVQGMNTVLQQGEARPERILRRFFNGLTEIWAQIHELNQRFLPERKKILVSGNIDAGEDPYQTITDTHEIEGRYQFDFKANVFNSSKVAMQQALGTLMTTYINEMTIQMGLIQPDGAYRLLRDFGKANGIDPDRYIQAPSADASAPLITAEEALLSILQMVIPEGVPAEGAQRHLEKIAEFQQGEVYAQMDSNQIQLLEVYVQSLIPRLEKEMQMQQMAAAAQSLQGGGGGATEGGGSDEPTKVGKNELSDETLPSAGGGGNAEFMHG